jgi:uncharacterized delta-60 repeat protein
LRVLLNAGDLDTGFSGGIARAPSSVEMSHGAVATALQADGKIVQVGAVQGSSNQSETDFALVRYNADGTMDTHFGNGGVVLTHFGQAGAQDGATAVTILASGKILVAGGVDTKGTTSFFTVARYNADGSLDMTFGTGGLATPFSGPSSNEGTGYPGTEATSLVVRSDGTILVAGVYFNGPPAASATSQIVALNPDGSPDANFPAINLMDGGNLGAPGLALTPNGKLIVARIDVYRFNADGGPDLAFGTNGHMTPPLPGAAIAPVAGLAVQPDGKLVAVVSPSTSAELIRVNVNGMLDVTFGGTGVVESAYYAGPVVVQPNGRIVAVGNLTSGYSLFRYNPYGTVDTTFGTNGQSTTNFPVNESAGPAAMLLQPDGKILVGGGIASPMPGFPIQIVVQWFAARYFGDTATGTASQRYVWQLYLDLLQRPADAAGLAHWSGLIDSGQATNAQVAQMIETTPEYDQDIIEQFYGEYLNRPADSAGLSGWQKFLASGGTIDQMRAMILGSAEYYQDAGNSNDGFVTAIYRDLLGRVADAGGRQGWDQALMNGTSPTTVAMNILRSAEGSAYEVEGLYYWLLHRAADPAGLQSFSSDLQQGTPVEQIVAIIAGSPEYAATRT